MSEEQSAIDRRKFIFVHGTICLLGAGMPIGPKSAELTTVVTSDRMPAYLNSVELPLASFHGTLEEFRAHYIATLDRLIEAVKTNSQSLNGPDYFTLPKGVITQDDRLQQVLNGVVLYRTPAAPPEPKKEG